jgi:hypothetical protein
MKILFPDTSLLASMRGVELKQGAVLHHGEPVLVPDRAWEGILAYLYGSVSKRGRLYRMWYQGQGVHVCYARSRDGVRWEKPLVGHSEGAPPAPATTVLMRDGEAIPTAVGAVPRARSNVLIDYHMPSVVADPRDRKAPYRLFGYTDAGYAVAFSRDGVRFRESKRNPIIPLMRFPDRAKKKTWFSDVAPVFYDARKKRFVAHVKTYETDREGRIRRSVGYSESRDFVRWKKPATIWTPGDADDRLARKKGFQWADFYGLCGFNYGAIYLGLSWMFFIDYEIERGTHEGKIEVYLASSPDGKSWKRFSDEPLLPLGGAGWDSGMVTTAGAPLFEQDRISLYYGGANFTHGVGEEENKPYDEARHRFSIGLATLRKDGFVYAAARQGHFMTKPLPSKTGRIKINADARRGRIVVEAAENKKPGGRFELAGADVLDHAIRTGAQGRVRLKVTLENAELYSLEIF